MVCIVYLWFSETEIWSLVGEFQLVLFEHCLVDDSKGIQSVKYWSVVPEGSASEQIEEEVKGATD